MDSGGGVIYPGIVALADGLKVRFWGVRGSIACPGPEYARYGGNTPCLEVMAGGRRLIFDAGTGIRELGLELARQAPLDIDIYFTHTHLDHLAGLTFFAPLFDKRNSIRMWAGHLEGPHTLKTVVKSLMQAPLYPVSLEAFQATITFREFDCGAVLSCGDISLRTGILNHPNGATGYRVDHKGKSLCYITDTEHRPEGIDTGIVDLCRGADLMIYDSTFTDAEYPRYRGWGHSTWQEGVRVADAAQVGTLVIFHHDPNHDDAFMDAVARDAALLRPGTTANGLPRVIVAHEGLILSP
ncbi:Phosphoribosyl 1,2-cyclic phosphodiesterase [Enhydrobacter aerosaccus]|uniref:Phosphoribosyl 1,2-cyclic phosphodiesterase n=1 Tax=Enhydrobacter aerosaccus TaxID=225324 RepID=A0A1T4QPP9_9HYPH|nr:Phosphoribosyl 1,2-cyclic phosphodiesterase [Enhydrobacter aerosaccus]